MSERVRQGRDRWEELPRTWESRALAYLMAMLGRNVELEEKGSVDRRWSLDVLIETQQHRNALVKRRTTGGGVTTAGWKMKVWYKLRRTAKRKWSHQFHLENQHEMGGLTISTISAQDER